MRALQNSRIRTAWLTVAIAIVAAVALIDAKDGTPPSRRSDSNAHQVRVRSAYGNLPLSFEENRGQTDPRAKFLARGGGYTLFLTSTEAVLKLRAPSSAKKKAGALQIAFHPESIEKQKSSVVRISLEGANTDSQASGVDQLPGRSNYFIGKDPAKWRRNVPSFSGVKVRGIYPGIDLVYRGTQGRLEYDFVVAPGADPERIKLQVDGSESLTIASNGDLLIKTSGGNVIEKAPTIYQNANGTQHLVKGGYVLVGKNGAAFKVEAYDRTQPLIIDPLLTYASYLGGSGDEEGAAIAVDSGGNAIVTGFTDSTDFPVQAAFQPNYFGRGDAFITKVNPSGTALVYSTYAGGSSGDGGLGVAIDPNGNAYIVGVTTSTVSRSPLERFRPRSRAPNAPLLWRLIRAVDSSTRRF